MKKNALLILLLCMVCGCTKLTVDNSVIDSLDVNRYLGEWYEIARYDHRFERGMENTRAIYSMRDDGMIDVINTGVKDGERKESKGKAKLTDTPALLRVSFFGPFYSDYRVMMLDADYQYALIGSGSDDYLWILSRKPSLPDTVKQQVIKEAQRRGYDTSKLIWVRH